MTVEQQQFREAQNIAQRLETQQRRKREMVLLGILAAGYGSDRVIDQLIKLAEIDGVLNNPLLMFHWVKDRLEGF